MEDKKYLVGSGECKIDEKGRIIFPAPLRRELEEKFTIDRRVFITMLSPNEIRIYPIEEWDNITRRIMDIKNSELSQYEKDKAWGFLFLGNKYGESIEIDKQNRVKIPKKLRDKMKLDGKVEIVGMGNHYKLFSMDFSQKLEKEIEEKFDFTKVDF